MNKRLFLLPLAALLLQACSNDFDVVAPWKEVPVVYAILSPDDTAHYIRVEKAFLDPDKSALEIAQIADSLYYPENAIAVYLERISNGKQIPLTRVDGNLEGYVRSGGIFATQPNWLYKFKPAPPDNVIVPGEKYRFMLVRADGKPNVTAETTIPDGLKITTPSPVDLPPMIAFGFGDNATVDWRSDINGVLFSVHFRIRYRDEFSDGNVVHDTLYWTPVTNVEREENAIGAGGNVYRGSAKVSGDLFFNFLVDNIPAAGDRLRYFDGIDITVEGGGSEIKKYLETVNANSGLSGAEIVTTYSNLSEGFGIFTAKNSVTMTKIKVTKPTIDAMNSKSPTRDLNFRYF